jgi:Tfp pilus assembly protein PilF
MNPRIASLEKMLDGPRDGALLRFSLGNEYLKEGQLEQAEICFKNAVDRNKHYSAAWKALGKTLLDAGKAKEALETYETGITIAEGQGDIQAVKEMTVFAKRIRKAQESNQG